jgi:hypothetical protein
MSLRLDKFFCARPWCILVLVALLGGKLRCSRLGRGPILITLLHVISNVASLEEVDQAAEFDWSDRPWEGLCIGFGVGGASHVRIVCDGAFRCLLGKDCTRLALFDRSADGEVERCSCNNEGLSELHFD